MWWKFRRHRLAVGTGAFLRLLYFSILITEFLAPYALHTRHVDFIYAPPQRIHFFHEGSFVGPFVYGYTYRLDLEPEAGVHRRPDKVQPLRFFCRGDRTDSGAYPTGICIWSARPRAARCSCSAPTGSGATCCRASSTARGSRSPSA